METFEEDQLFLAETTGITAALGGPEAIYSKRLNTFQEHDPGERTRKYFKELSAKQKQKLWKLYKLDFELFGYKAKPYL